MVVVVDDIFLLYASRIVSPIERIPTKGRRKIHVIISNRNEFREKSAVRPFQPHRVRCTKHEWINEKEMNISARRCEISFEMSRAWCAFYSFRVDAFLSAIEVCSYEHDIILGLNIFWLMNLFNTVRKQRAKKGTKRTALDRLVAATSSKIIVLLLIPTCSFIFIVQHLFIVVFINNFR